MPTASSRRLSSRFYCRSTEVVARALLGKRLIRGDRAGTIVETEAYLGPEDKASHARFGPTPRARVMFGPGGRSYVYLCYGVHEMFNVVSGRAGEPGAVLVRALDLSPMERGRAADPARARGPGKLTRALGIDRRHNDVDLTHSDELFIGPGRRVTADQIARGPRVGVAYAGTWAAAPLRFWIAGHPAVSRPPRSALTATHERG